MFDMSIDADIAKQFKKTYDQYPVLFKFIEHTQPNETKSLDYISRNFCKIAEQIDELFKAPSIKDYILNFSKNPEINTPDYSDPELKSLSPGGSTILKTKTIFPLKDFITINDENIEVDSVVFSVFTEQLVINFGINLCIVLSEIMEPQRSKYSDRNLLEPVEYSITTQKDFLELTEKAYVKESKEQAKRFYPKVWELYEDNNKLIRCLSQHLNTLKTAIVLEPYFLQSQTFHRIFSQIPISTNQRFNFTQEFFLQLNKVKIPTADLMAISRSLLALRTFNPDVFKVESKMDELIVPALIQADIFEAPYATSSVRRAYFATMRNH